MTADVPGVLIAEDDVLRRGGLAERLVGKLVKSHLNVDDPRDLGHPGHLANRYPRRVTRPNIKQLGATMRARWWACRCGAGRQRTSRLPIFVPKP